jgi:hypothetical protein
MAKTKQCLALQITIGLMAMIPIFVGINGISRGPAILDKTSNYSIPLDSHFRYLSGFPVAMGIMLLRSLPTIDRDNSDLRRACLLIVIGGLGRLWGLISVGLETGVVIATIVELFVLPFLCL